MYRESPDESNEIIDADRVINEFEQSITGYSYFYRSQKQIEALLKRIELLQHEHMGSKIKIDFLHNSNRFWKEQVSVLKTQNDEYQTTITKTRADTNALAQDSHKLMCAIKESRDEFRARAETLKAGFESVGCLNAKLQHQVKNGKQQLCTLQKEHGELKIWAVSLIDELRKESSCNEMQAKRAQQALRDHQEVCDRDWSKVDFLIGSLKRENQELKSQLVDRLENRSVHVTSLKAGHPQRNIQNPATKDVGEKESLLDFGEKVQSFPRFFSDFRKSF